MCECGCVTRDRIFSLPGPKGKTYLLNFTFGCSDCETPAGIYIQEVDDKAKEWLEFSEGKLPLFKREEEGRVFPVMIADGNELTKLFTDFVLKGFGVKDLYETEKLDWFDEDELRNQIFDYLSSKITKSFDEIRE
jgi:hypothetical protein